jgi:periplasmic protein TonB
MSHDMFSDLVSRRASIRSRRAPLVVASVVTHALAVLAIVMLSLVATEALPSPREAIEFYDSSVHVADVPPPPPPRRIEPALPPPEVPTVSPNAAPLVAPEGIAPESGIEQTVETSSRVGLVFGVASSAPEGFGWREPAPPPPPAAPAVPVRLHSGIEAPQKLVNVSPIYPQIATAAHIEGVVIVETTIDDTGQVVGARVLRSVPSLDAAALDAVRQWRYRPALLNGVPIPVIMTVTVRFALTR